MANKLDKVFRTSKGEQIPTGARIQLTVDNPLTVIQQAHAQSDRVNMTAYQNAFEAVKTLSDNLDARDENINQLEGQLRRHQEMDSDNIREIINLKSMITTNGETLNMAEKALRAIHDKIFQLTENGRLGSGTVLKLTEIDEIVVANLKNLEPSQ